MISSRTLIACLAALAAMACSSPPEAPSVDDASRRPVNPPLAIDMQRCKGDLSATRIRLTEALNADAVRAAATQRRLDSSGNRVLVVGFRSGSAEFVLPPEHQARVLEQVRQAGYIVIRGRTDALGDSLSETRLAQRRAEATAAYLQRMAGAKAEDMRVTWQGAGDRLSEGSTPADRDANRRVEIELYPGRPQREVLAATRSGNS